MEEETNKIGEKLEIRDEKGRFVEGHPDLGAGRPKGKTLKEWMREKLLNMTLEQREEFLKDIPKDLQWRMAEGNPKQDTDIMSGGEKIIPIYNGQSLQTNNSDQKDISTTEENKSSVGGDISQ